MGNNAHIGSSLDDFLSEEGFLADAEAVALKRVIAFEIAKEMKSAHISKTALAQRMKTSRIAVNRLLDPESKSLTLGTVARAATALGKQVRITFVSTQRSSASSKVYSGAALKVKAAKSAKSEKKVAA